MNAEIVIKAGGIEIPLSVAQEVAKLLKTSRATVARLQQPKPSPKPEKFSLDGGKMPKPLKAWSPIRRGRIHTALSDSTLRQLQGYALSKHISVSSAVDQILHKTLRSKNLANVDFSRSYKRGTQKKQHWVAIKPTTRALVEKHRNGCDYSTFIRGIVEAFFKQ